MNKGTVKFFNETKGFGFIKDADSTKEYFVHINGCKDEIQEKLTVLLYKSLRTVGERKVCYPKGYVLEGGSRL